MKTETRSQKCRWKNHYPTMAMAERARVRNQNRHGWLLKIYKCTECDEFHLSRFRVRGKPVPIVGPRNPDTDTDIGDRHDRDTHARLLDDH
jgi:hypothetical protein